MAVTDLGGRTVPEPGESELLVGLTDLAVGMIALALTGATLAERTPDDRADHVDRADSVDAADPVDRADPVDAADPADRTAGRGHLATRRRELRRGFAVFFGSVAVASLSGAALHGLFPDRSDARRRPLWRLSLGAIGTSAAAGIDVAAALAMPRRAAVVARAAAAAVLAGWFTTLARSLPPYRAAVALTVPSIVVLAVALAGRLAVARERQAAVLGLGGLAGTVAAAIVQVSGVGLGRRFGPNATYHSVQALALLVLGRSAAAFLDVPTGPPGPAASGGR